jgi:omega-amidase
MKSELKVTVIQDDISWQDPAANRSRYSNHFAELKDTDLIVLPEFFSTGFYTDPKEEFETMDGKTVDWMLDNAVKFDVVISGSVVMKLEDRFVNRMLWAKPDGGLDWYDKRHLFRFGGEHHNYSGGNDRTVFELHGWRIVLFVCYDLRFPVWSRNLNDYDVALYVANWPNSRQYAWDTLLKARAIENQAYVVGVNRLGENPNGDCYSGGSVVLDFMGKSMEDFGDKKKTITTHLSKQDLIEYRQFFPASMDSDHFDIKI